MKSKRMIGLITAVLSVCLLLSGCGNVRFSRDSVTTSEYDINSTSIFPVQVHSDTVGVYKEIYNSLYDGIRIYKNNKHIKTIRGIINDFRLTDNEVIVYTVGQKLKLINLTDDSEKIIAEKVMNFQTDGNTVYYNTYNRDLYRLKDSKTELVSSDVNSFCLSNDMIFFVKRDETIWKTSKTNLSPVQFSAPELHTLPDSMLAVGDWLVLCP